MFRWAVIWVALASACSDTQEARLEKVKDEVCACKTAGCAEKAMKAVPQQDVVSTHRSQQVAREMLDCLAKLYEAERPEDPDSN